jgi:CDP-diacylglycerol--glycerol-3-phosphate 3-phosphatidyltransferase
MRQLPYYLIYARLIFGLVILVLSILTISSYQYIAISLLSLGLLTDIFDGIIARHLNISTQRMRRLDSNIDQVFFICVGLATFVQCSEFFILHWIEIALLLSAEAIAYLTSYLKFRKEIATHSIGAKLWSLILFAALVQIIWQCNSGWIFQSCIILGIITRLEIVAIIIVLKQWTSDVPTLYHAFQINRGKKIKKNNLFNG